MSSEKRRLDVDEAQVQLMSDAINCWLEHHPQYEPERLARLADAAHRLERDLDRISVSPDPDSNGRRRLGSGMR